MLHPLAIRADEDGYVVGRLATGSFVVLPALGARVLELLGEGRDVSETEAIVAGEGSGVPDVTSFAKELCDLGFVASVDGRTLPEDPRKPTLAWLRRQHVAWLYSRSMKLAYAALLLVAVITLAARPTLLPAASDFFWTDSTGVVLASNLALFLVFLSGHELSHLVAARSLGAPAWMRLGTRLHHLVVETDISGLWSVPRRQRYRAYLAGLFWDTTVVAALLLVLAYAPLADRARAPIEAALLLVGLAMIQQLCLYMRTDLYFVALDLFRCGNLFEDSLALVRYQLRRLARVALGARIAESADPRTRIPEREHRVVTAYAACVLAGSTIALTLYAIYGLPILTRLLTRAAHETATGITTGDPARAADGIATLGVEALLLGLFVTTFVRTHEWTRRPFVRLNRAPAPASDRRDGA